MGQRRRLALSVRTIAAVVFALSGAVALALMIPFAVAWWGTLSSAEKPAWMQAIGAVVALAIAVGVPVYQWRVVVRQKLADELGAARSLAIVVFPSVARTTALLEQFDRKWGIEQEYLHTVTYGGSYLPEPLDQALVIPPDLVENAGKLHGLGSAAASAQLYFHNLRELKYLVDWHRLAEELDPDIEFPDRARVRLSLSRTLSLGKQCCADIDALFRAGKDAGESAVAYTQSELAILKMGGWVGSDARWGPEPPEKPNGLAAQ